MLLVCLAIGLSACAVRTTVPASTVPVPETLTDTYTSDAAVERDWWRQFDDPVLDRLAAEALTANRDVHAAAARVAAARALAGAEGLGHLPSGGVVVGAARQHLSAREAGGRDLPSRTGSHLHAGVELAWEADLFGRLRGRARAAAADATALAMDARAVQVAVAAQVASAYFDYLGAQREAALVGEMRTRTRALLDRTTTLVSAGRLTRLDLLRVQQIDEDLTGEQSATAHAAERARLRLATLTGRTGEQWQVPDTPPRPYRTSRLPIDSASDAIRRRPDVAAAALRLDAAAARAGVARAELFPRIDLTGGVALIAGSVGQLTDVSAGSWLIAPRLVWSVLDWPRLKRRLRAAGALTDAAFAEYEQATLRAVEEVQVAVNSYGSATERLRSAERRADASSGAAAILDIQYREGLVDSLSRTLAERDAIAGALAVSRALTEHRQAVVAVYRALGGGWR
ncbi:MAG: TolC family protein [Vicinamibacterales bacterium]|nr:TolC family protein [Vicinamibacterales bacterium]